MDPMTKWTELQHQQRPRTTGGFRAPNRLRSRGQGPGTMLPSPGALPPASLVPLAARLSPRCSKFVDHTPVARSRPAGPRACSPPFSVRSVRILLQVLATLGCLVILTDPRLAALSMPAFACPVLAWRLHVPSPSPVLQGQMALLLVLNTNRFQLVETA
jgi:hypothetical protein